MTIGRDERNAYWCEFMARKVGYQDTRRGLWLMEHRARRVLTSDYDLLMQRFDAVDAETDETTEARRDMEAALYS